MRALLIIVSLMFVVPSCKKNEEANIICFTRTSTELKIENNTNKEIYFTAYDQDVLPLIDWIPLCGNNYIPPHSSLDTSLSSIFAYSPGKPIVVFWWECRGNTPGDMQHVTLYESQSACR